MCVRCTGTERPGTLTSDVKGDILALGGIAEIGDVRVREQTWRSDGRSRAGGRAGS